jgi:hypothetical protein
MRTTLGCSLRVARWKQDLFCQYFLRLKVIIGADNIIEHTHYWIIGS